MDNFGRVDFPIGLLCLLPDASPQQIKQEVNGQKEEAQPGTNEEECGDEHEHFLRHFKRLNGIASWQWLTHKEVGEPKDAETNLEYVPDEVLLVYFHFRYINL